MLVLHEVTDTEWMTARRAASVALSDWRKARDDVQAYPSTRHADRSRRLRSTWMTAQERFKALDQARKRQMAARTAQVIAFEGSDPATIPAL
jgi:hypothetical protein